MTSSEIEPATFRQKGWEVNKGEMREGDEDIKGTKEWKERNDFPVVCIESDSSNNIMGRTF
jgi:hypothetical protein